HAETRARAGGERGQDGPAAREPQADRRAEADEDDEIGRCPEGQAKAGYAQPRASAEHDHDRRGGTRDQSGVEQRDPGARPGPERNHAGRPLKVSWSVCRKSPCGRLTAPRSSESSSCLSLTRTSRSSPWETDGMRSSACSVIAPTSCWPTSACRSATATRWPLSSRAPRRPRTFPWSC